MVPSRSTVQFDVRKATHSGADREYLMMVVFDPARIALTASWLIPMAVVPDVATTQAEKFALVPSLSAGRVAATALTAVTTSRR